MESKPNFQLSIPEGDNRERQVCGDCGFIHYENPRNLANETVNTISGAGAVFPMAVGEGDLVGGTGQDLAASDNAGNVYIFPDTSTWTGMTTASASVVVQGGGVTEFGRTLLVADVDNNGSRELVIGAPGATAPTAGANAGAIFVFQRSALVGTVTPAAARATVYGAATGDRLGASLARGAITNAANQNLLVGANCPTNGRPGFVYAMNGPALTAAPVTIDLAVSPFTGLTFTGPAGGGRFGSAMAVGRFDDAAPANDCLAVSATALTSGAVSGGGAVYVIFGQITAGVDWDLGAGPIDPSRVTVLSGTATNENCGQALVVGDMTYDATDDLAVGAISADPSARSNAGSVFVVDGDMIAANRTNTVLLTDGTFANPSTRIDGAVTLDELGLGLTVGNFDGNTKDDLAIGAKGYDWKAGTSYAVPSSGAVFLVYDALLATTSVDLASQANWTLRYGGHTLGAAAGEPILGTGITGMTRDSLIIGARGALGSEFLFVVTP